MNPGEDPIMTQPAGDESASGRQDGVPASGAGQPGTLPKELVAEARASKRTFLEIGLSCLTDEAFLNVISEAVKNRSRLTVSFINPDYVLRAHRTAGLIEKINRFDVVLPDGWGVVVGAHWVGVPVPTRQGNGRICPLVFALSAEHGFRNFLFGCGEGVPERAAANATEAFPGLPIAGTLHGHWDLMRGHPGSFDESDVSMMVETINAAQPDILHVSIPTPMQQTWVWQVADRLDVPVIITGGSYLDHLAEAVDWYPHWMEKMRLNWAYRLYRDPRRLWRRYTFDLTAYGRMVLRQRLAQGRRATSA